MSEKLDFGMAPEVHLFGPAVRKLDIGRRTRARRIARRKELARLDREIMQFKVRNAVLAGAIQALLEQLEREHKV